MAEVRDCVSRTRCCLQEREVVETLISAAAMPVLVAGSTAATVPVPAASGAVAASEAVVPGAGVTSEAVLPTPPPLPSTGTVNGPAASEPASMPVPVDEAASTAGVAAPVSAAAPPPPASL